MSTDLEPDLERVYLPFLDLIKSSNSISLTDDVLYGAITHFISVLPTTHLAGFVEALCTSASLQCRPSSSTSSFTYDLRLLRAVALAVSAKVAGVRQSLGDAYFANARADRHLRSWILCLFSSIPTPFEQGLRDGFLVGLLRGVHEEKSVKWAAAREELELEVATCIDTSLRSGQGLPLLLGPALPLLGDSKVLLVSGEVLSEQLIVALTHIVLPFTGVIDSRSVESISQLSKAVAKVIRANARGGQHAQERAVDLSRSFLEVISRACGESEERWVANTTVPSDIEPYKSLLFALILPSLAMLDGILLSAAAAPAELASSILQALADMAYLTGGAVAGMDGWDRLFYGCLDVIDACRFRIDLQAMASGPAADERAAFALAVAEQLMPRVDIDFVLRLAEKHIQRPDARPAFEAAHAVMLALLKGASASGGSKQEAFTRELMRYYCAVILQQSDKAQLTSDQTRAAYPAVLQAAASLSIRDAKQALDAFDEAYGANPTQTLRLTRLAMIPHVPTPLLTTFLDETASVIIDASAADKAALNAVAFKTIVEELGDEGKVIGMGWWLDWRDRLQEGAPSATPQIPKL